MDSVIDVIEISIDHDGCDDDDYFCDALSGNRQNRDTFESALGLRFVSGLFLVINT